MEEVIENTGYLPDPRPIEERQFDWDLEKLAGINRVRTTIWSPYIPQGVGQGFTQSCVSFSLVHVAESILNYDYINNLLPVPQKMFLETKGYIVDGKVKLSVKHIATVSGTTKKGNYFQKVGQTARDNGFVPFSMLPHGDVYNFDEFVRLSDITQSIKDVGLQFKKYFTTNYGGLYGDETPGVISENEKSIIKNSLQYAPLQIGITGHAMMIFDLKEKPASLDTFTPFIKDPETRPINFYMSLAITPNEVTETKYPQYIFARNLTKGMRGADVKILQDILKIEGCLDITETTNFYGTLTFNAVKKFQEKYKSEILTPVGLSKGTGLFYNSTRAFINNLIK